VKKYSELVSSVSTGSERQSIMVTMPNRRHYGSQVKLLYITKIINLIIIKNNIYCTGDLIQINELRRTQ